MRELNQFIVWRSQARPNSDRSDKIPVHPTKNRKINAMDPTNWMSYEEALEHTSRLSVRYEIGFVFTSNDPYWFIDIDECVTDGKWHPIVDELFGRLPGVVFETSMSGRGCHMFGKGTIPDEYAIKAKEFDLYRSGRFVALANPDVPTRTFPDLTPQITAVCNDYLRLDTSPNDTATPMWTTEPCDEWDGIEDDDKLIERACRSMSAEGAFRIRASFKDLWLGRDEMFGEYWPPEGVTGHYDRNRADAALAQHLAFWTGKDCARIERLMRRSALYRPKWERADYLERTILRAVNQQKDVYCRKKPEKEERQMFLSITDQLSHFNDCVYVQDQHRVFVPSGALLKPEQFRAVYGGHMFSMDLQNEKLTKNAFEAFTESRGHNFPKCTSTRFDPDVPPSDITDDRVNVFVPKWGRCSVGDTSLFQRHIDLLLPDPGDRDILLSFMAGCIQQAGTKAQWAPCVQGIDGNGKTVLYRVLEHAIGWQYCHLLDPKDIDNKFNAWIDRKLLVCVEEIRTAGKWEIADILKPLITNHRVAMQAKREDQRTGDNRANFLLFSNYKDAVLKTRNDRRYCVLYSAQQSIEDIARDGMDETYFKKLYDWLGSGGFEAVTDWLSKYRVNVNLKGRAPKTTSTDEAIVKSLGTAEQIILEAIELEELGFRGGIISGQSASALLTAHGKRFSPRAISSILKQLGYVRPPALERSEGKIKINSNFIRIYINYKSELYNYKSPAEIIEYYTRVTTEKL